MEDWDTKRAKTDFDLDRKRSSLELMRKKIEPYYVKLFKTRGIDVDKVIWLEWEDVVRKKLEFSGVDFILTNGQELLVQEKIRFWDGKDPYIIIEVEHDVRKHIRGWADHLMANAIVITFWSNWKQDISYTSEKSIFFFDGERLRTWYKDFIQNKPIDVNKHMQKERFWDIPTGSKLVNLKTGESYDIFLNKETEKEGIVRNISSHIRIPTDNPLIKRFDFFEGELFKYLKSRIQ